MMTRVLTLVALLATATVGWADEKDAKPGTGGPPPGKGYRRNEVPKAVPAKPVKSQPPVAAAKPQPGGIGKYVSQWARSGIRGPALAAKIHELHASLGVKSESPKPPVAKPATPYLPEVPMPKPKNPKKKGGGE